MLPKIDIERVIEMSESSSTKEKTEDPNLKSSRIQELYSEYQQNQHHLKKKHDDFMTNSNNIATGGYFNQNPKF